MTCKPLQKFTLAGAALFTPILVLAQQNPTVLTPGELTALDSNLFGQLPLVMMIGLFVVIVAAIYFASQRDRRKQEFLARFVDKEQAIPQELLPAPPSRHRELRRGTWLLSLGLGVGLVLYIATSDWHAAAWSLILLFLAAASFINAKFFYPGSGSGRQAGNGQ